MSFTDQITARFEQFGIKTFGSERGWKKKYAEALELSQGGLQLYLTGRSRPGPIIQARLRELGCDIEWLMTGKEAGAEHKTDDTIIRLYSKSEPTTEQLAVMRSVIDAMDRMSGEDSELLAKIAQDIVNRKRPNNDVDGSGDS